MRSIAHNAHYRLVACVIPITVAIVLACGTTPSIVTSPPLTKLKLYIRIFEANLDGYGPYNLAPGVAHIIADFYELGGPTLVISDMILTCNQVTFQRGKTGDPYQADVPIPTFPNGYTFTYQAKNQHASITIPTLRPVIVSPVAGSRATLPSHTPTTIPITYRIDGNISATHPRVDLYFGASDGNGHRLSPWNDVITLNQLPLISNTDLDVSSLTPSTGSITFYGRFQSDPISLPSNFGSVAIEYQFATNVSVVWKT
jgi:hypothetical protein